MPGRLHGHYPDLARRSRGRRHSDIGGSWGLRRAAARRRAFLSKISAGCMPQQTQTLHVWPWRVGRTPYSVSEQDLSLPPIMKFQQQQQQTHSDSSKMNILLILRKSENKRSI